MEEHSKKVQPVAVPVWLIMKPAISPHFIQKMKAESSNPAAREMENT
ncbi:hypothetical protein [uncultured Desulfobacter sp.]|nr:hypothetical protein [uncultured Desulfobacter sp.]